MPLRKSDRRPSSYWRRRSGWQWRERERLAEEKTAKAIEELEARHNASNQALYELFVVSHLFIFTLRMHVMFVYISK